MACAWFIATIVGSMSHFATPAMASTAVSSISGIVVDQATGEPLVGLKVSVAPYSADYEDAMAGDAVPAIRISTTVTGVDGSFAISTQTRSPVVLVDVYGAPQGHVTFHGVFVSGVVRIPVIRLVEPTHEERRALAQINAFRAAPGGTPRYGDSKPLVFDQNLVESARYWALQEKRARRIGHTCAQLGNPTGCVEFNAYFHALPGAPQDDDAGQNAAFDSATSWSEPDQLFEVEGSLCRYNWHSCPGGNDGASGQTGHYLNLMLASRWIGFGKAVADGYGSFFAQNLI